MGIRPHSNLMDMYSYVEGSPQILFSHNAPRFTEQAASCFVEDEGVGRDLERMAGIMRIEQTGNALAGQGLNRLQHNKLILEIKVGFRLIQDENLGIGNQRSGNEHHLQFAAAHLVAGFAAEIQSVSRVKVLV